MSREIVVVWYLDHVKFEMSTSPPPVGPASCMIMGILIEETDDAVKIVYQEEGMWGEIDARTHGMVLVKGAITQLVRTGVEAVPDEP